MGGPGEQGDQPECARGAQEDGKPRIPQTAMIHGSDDLVRS